MFPIFAFYFINKNNKNICIARVYEKDRDCEGFKLNWGLEGEEKRIVERSEKENKEGGKSSGAPRLKVVLKMTDSVINCCSYESSVSRVF